MKRRHEGHILFLNAFQFVYSAVIFRKRTSKHISHRPWVMHEGENAPWEYSLYSFTSRCAQMHKIKKEQTYTLVEFFEIFMVEIVNFFLFSFFFCSFSQWFEWFLGNALVRIHQRDNRFKKNVKGNNTMIIDSFHWDLQVSNTIASFSCSRW